MKKFILAAGLLLFGFMNAQIAVTTNGQPITNNQVFTYTTVNAMAELPFIVTNTSESDAINIKIRVDEISNTDGTNCQLCFGGLCFFAINQGIIYPTNFAVTLAPDESTVAGDHFWNTNPGDGSSYPMQYKLTFVQVDDNGLYMNDLLTLTYIYNPNLATPEFGMQQAGIARINTLVGDAVSFEATQAGTFELIDMNGKTVISRKVEPGFQAINAQSLTSGIYVARFQNGANQSAQLKLIKQ
jgi:hypothetical protein